MKKLTKKQRNGIYNKCINNLDYSNGFVCHYLKSIGKINNGKEVNDLFPELCDFNKRENGIELKPIVYGAFLSDDEMFYNKGHIIIKELILMFCIEMTNPK